MQAVHPRVSYAEMEHWPEDGRRYELYDGEVFEIPSPIPLHQMVSARLYLALQAYVSTHGGIVLYAPLDIVLTDYDVVQPDLVLFTRERQHLIDPKKVTRNPPDLAVEILSPGTETNDRGRKLRLLARHGVREYWLVDPEKGRVEVFTLAGDLLALVTVAASGQSVLSRLLPELQLQPGDLLPSQEH